MKKPGCRNSPLFRQLLLCGVLLLSLFCPDPAAAQYVYDSTDEEEISYAEDDFEGYLDPSALDQPRANNAPTPAEWSSLTSDKEFYYRQEIEGVEDIPKEEPRRKVSMPTLPTGIAKLLLILLVVGAAAFILYNLFGKSGGLFARRSRRQAVPGEEEEEDELAALPASELERRMEEAAAKGNLRLATRLGFLRTLQVLDLDGHITLQPEKTNHAYERELGNNASLRTVFREMRISYERAWYGGLPPTAESYAAYARLFNRVKSESRG